MEINVETAVRICPLYYNTNDIIGIQPNTVNNTIQLADSQNYPVNYVFPVDCCQNTICSTAVSPMINYFLEGCDVSIVTLGQSGTGKSYTLLGPGFHFASSEAEHGIIPRFIREVFTRMKQYRDRQHSIHITWSQICGENVQDLLGVGSVECINITDVFQLIQLGMSNVAPKCAHTLFTLTLEQQWIVDGIVQHKISTASFTDLAGVKQAFIYDRYNGIIGVPTDPGFQALEGCILQLSETCNQKCNYIPYSQSVLTTLLKDSFGGRAKTLIICCISPLMKDLSETTYYLQLCFRARMIKNVVTINSYTTVEPFQENCDVFGLQFAANQLFKLVSNAEELFQRLVSNGALPKNEQEQISQWLMLKQECEDCLSENSEPHRSLERIEEEIEGDSSSSESEIVDYEEKDDLLDQVQFLIEDFKSNTIKLIHNSNVTDLTVNLLARESVQSSNNAYHMKGARGRRGSIHSAQELRSLSPNITKINEECGTSDNEPKLDSATTIPTHNKKKILKQIVTELLGYQKQIADLERTIEVKENLMLQLLKHKDTKSSAHQKIEQRCQKLRKDLENIQSKLLQAQKQKNSLAEEKYKTEINSLEEKLHDTESLKNITEDGNRKLIELENSLHTSKKQLEKLIKRKHKEEKRKLLLERQLKEEKISCNSLNNQTSSDKIIVSSEKVLAVIEKSNETFDSNLSLNSEESECLRHEIRSLRKTRDYLLEQKCKIDVKSQNKKILNDLDERKLIQYEEAIEAIDLTIDYKNQILCGHQPLNTKILEEETDQLLMERLLNLNESEMRILLHQYFDKIVDLRSSSKKLEMQVIDMENQNENLTYRVHNLNQTLQKVRLDAERRYVSLQQQHEDNLYLMLRHLASDGCDNERVLRSKHCALTLQLPGRSKDKNSLITRFTEFARQETVPRQLQSATPALPQAKVTRQKNKLIIQQTNT